MIYVYQNIVPEKGRLFAEIKKVNLDKLPIRKIDFSNSVYKAKHNKMVELVSEMIQTQKMLLSAKTNQDREIHKQKISFIDNQIDRAIYDLYNLTKEEIEAIENFIIL